MAQSALFIAIFYGIQIVWERDAGVLTKLMVTPTPRLRVISKVNPLSYEVKALRGLLIGTQAGRDSPRRTRQPRRGRRTVTE